MKYSLNMPFMNDLDIDFVQFVFPSSLFILSPVVAQDFFFLFFFFVEGIEGKIKKLMKMADFCHFFFEGGKWVQNLRRGGANVPLMLPLMPPLIGSAPASDPNGLFEQVRGFI